MLTAQQAVTLARFAVKAASGLLVGAGHSREPNRVVASRHAVLWVARRIAPMATLSELGKAIGGMHHTSVMDALKAVERDPAKMALAKRALQIATGSDAEQHSLSDQQASEIKLIADELAGAWQQVTDAWGKVITLIAALLALCQRAAGTDASKPACSGQQELAPSQPSDAAPSQPAPYAVKSAEAIVPPPVASERCAERGCARPSWKQGLCINHWRMFNNPAPFRQQSLLPSVAMDHIGRSRSARRAD